MIKVTYSQLRGALNASREIDRLLRERGGIAKGSYVFHHEDTGLNVPVDPAAILAVLDAEVAALQARMVALGVEIVAEPMEFQYGVDPAPPVDHAAATHDVIRRYSR